MGIPKERVRETLLWAMMGLSGVGAVGANLGGAAAAERIVKLETIVEINVKRLERMESKIDLLIERGR